MRPSLRDKAIAVCDAKIAKKGEGVGLSFYAFFANKNDDPALLMEAADWWISRHQLNHNLCLDQLGIQNAWDRFDGVGKLRRHLESVFQCHFDLHFT